MLVLSRNKHQQTVVFDGEGKELGRVVVTGIEPGKKKGSRPVVSLGFDFKPEILILRAELVTPEKQKEFKYRLRQLVGDHIDLDNLAPETEGFTNDQISETYLPMVCALVTKLSDPDWGVADKDDFLQAGYEILDRLGKSFGVPD